MNPMDSRANVDFRLASDIHLNMKQPDAGHSLDARGASDGSMHYDFGGNLTSVSNIKSTHAIGTTGDFTNQDINGILSGKAWVIGDQNVTFSFPTSGSFYGSGYGDGEPTHGFTQFTAAQKDVVRYALDLIHQYTGINFQEITETSSTHATVRFAGSTVPSTSWAYYPDASNEAGDVWLGNVKDIAPTKAGYAFDTIMHEIGHTMGLKHGQEDDGKHGVLPVDHNSTEWSLMSYHSFVGGDEFYRNSDGSGNQSYMIDDISALQYLYGANFDANAGKTVYTWSKTTGEMSINGDGLGASETNTVYEAIWDGGGKDTYNLSKYTSDLHIDLNPGEWSTFDPAQLANLDSENPGDHLAPGNIANAHLFENDPRSLIEQAFGGKGDDTILGNIAKNLLKGGGGDDHLSGSDGNDVLLGGHGQDELTGGDGDDTFSFIGLKDSTSAHRDIIVDLEAGDRIDVSKIDADTTQGGDQAFALVNRFGHHAGEMTVKFDAGSHTTVVSLDVDGDAQADMVFAINGNQHNFSDFVF